MSHNGALQPGTPQGDAASSVPSADQPYASLAAPADPAATSAPAKSNRKKWIIVGAVVAVLALAGIGAGVGVAVSKKNKHTDLAGTGTSQTGSEPSTGSTNGTDSTSTNGTDWSIFAKDPKLKRVMYGIAYTAANALYPACGVTLEDVIRDVQLLSQLTNTIRLYGGNCNMPALILEAIALTKVDMKVYLGNYIVVANHDAYTGQKEAIESALTKYGTEHVLGINVGNEAMLNACLDLKITDPDSPVVQSTADYILSCISDTRTSLAALGISNVKVGTADAGSYFATSVLSAVDFALSNVHPWFAHQRVSAAAAWTWNFFDEENVKRAALLPNKPEMFLAETGWPTGFNGTADPTAGNSGAGVGGEASIANLQAFLDTFVCQSNAAGVKYFFFEMSDQIWKDEIYGGVEGYWGLLTSSLQLKEGITLPDCVY